MESFAEPLRRLHDDASWFVRATEVKLLHVRCDAALRKSALAVLRAMEAHPDNRSPYVVLEDAWKRVDRGWELRARRLDEHWEARRRATAAEGLELGVVSAQPPAGGPLAVFASWIYRVCQALRPPLDGLVVVLAPTRIEDADEFEAELTELVRRPELGSVRWIVVDLFEAPLDELAQELGARALRTECAKDDAAFARDLSAMMSSVDPLLPGPARAGAAWPRGVLAPDRRGPPPPTAEQRAEVEIELAAAGVSPALAGESGQRLQQYLLAAALEMKRGNGELALSHQREACRIAHEAQAGRELVLMWMVLAGYELALGHEDDAERQYREITAHAQREGCLLEQAQAGLALALLLARRGRHAEAATDYAAAADAALSASATGLAIECWRLAGHMAAIAGVETRAAECWQRAIELAEGTDPLVAKSSSAPLAARQLAERLRAQGFGAQADALEHQANRIEAGENRAAMEALA